MPAMTDPSDTTIEFEPSKLGKKQHWDEVYAKEIENFEDHGDIGEVWFGEDTADKMLQWVEDTIDTSASIIDLGCGNGHLILELASLGYTDLLGVDYSCAAVQLAQKIAKAQDKEMCRFDQLDILDTSSTRYQHQFNVALDKGTFDAISLATAKDYDHQNMPPAQRYISSVHQLLKPEGVLLLTSCNWTESELCHKFKDYFNLVDRIKYPSFTFGGQQGQKVTSIILKAKHI